MKKRKLFSIAMTLIMVVALVVALGVTASAAGAAWVNICGVTLNTTNSYLSYDPVTTTYSATTTEAGAVARFNAAESTLYLNGGINYSGNGTAIYADGDLTLNVTGTNSVTSIDYYTIDTVGNLTITGTGTLNITASAADCDAIWAESGNLNISGVTIVAAAGDQGLYSDYDMSITDASIDVTSNSDGLYTDGGDIDISDSVIDIVSNGDGIYAYESVSITDSDVTIDAGDYDIDGYSFDAIAAEYGSITITGGDVSAVGGQGIATYDSTEGVISIDGAVVYAEGTDDDAIQPAAGTMTITGGSDVTVAGDYGIYAYYGDVNLTVENSTLDVDTNVSAVNFYGGEIVIVSSSVSVDSNHGAGICAGIDADNDGYGIEIVNSTVTAVSGEYIGIRTDDYYSGNAGMYISGSTVTATGYECGIYTNADLTVCGDVVTATATRENSVGIVAAQLNVSGGTVTGKGEGAGIILLNNSDTEPMLLTNNETVTEGGQLHRIPYTISEEPMMISSVDGKAAERDGAPLEEPVQVINYVWVFSTADDPAYDGATGVFTDASAKVVIKPVNLDPTPKTGDVTGISMLFAIAAVTATGIVVLAKKKTEA